MTILQAELSVDSEVQLVPEDNGEAKGISYDGDVTVRISNDAKENGYPQDPGPLTWLNSARITTDPEHDSVHVNISVADPRGGFHFEIRRRPDTGAILIHMPHPGESMAHVETKELRPGTLVLCDEKGRERDFSDDEPEAETDGPE